ncbi:MAG: methylmalonyl-CoA mutase C-terminal domain/subunit [Bermanella sp.]|jgi:methylmalonyl-CoA mutase C-terminal domain/subunit
MEQPLRLLLAKIGLDTHTIGITVLAKELRDRGVEVIFSGLKQTPQQVARAALQEDVDVIGVSCLSGGHMTHLKMLAEQMRELGIDDRLLIVGGVVPEEDIEPLKALGVDSVFTMGANMDDIAAYLRSAVAAA